jgi:hypothetical protein
MTPQATAPEVRSGRQRVGGRLRLWQANAAPRADASTTGLADDLDLDVDGGRVTIRGAVDDLTDEDAVLSVAESVPGIREAVSRLEIRSLPDGGRDGRPRRTGSPR